MSPLLNSPLRRGELTSDFVLHRGNSLKFIPFISSNSRSLNSLRIEYPKERLRLTSRKNKKNGDDFHFLSHPRFFSSDIIIFVLHFPAGLAIFAGVLHRVSGQPSVSENYLFFLYLW